MNATQVKDLYKSANMVIRKVAGKYGRQLNPDQIEDLQQTILLRAIEYFDESKATENGMGALVYKVGTTVVIDYLKGKTYAGGAHKMDSLTGSDDSDDSDGVDVVSDVADHAPSALDMLASGELTVSLADALGSLPPVQRDAVVAFLNPDAPAATGAERIAKMRGIKAMREMFK